MGVPFYALGPIPVLPFPASMTFNHLNPSAEAEFTLQDLDALIFADCVCAASTAGGGQLCGA